MNAQSIVFKEYLPAISLLLVVGGLLPVAAGARLSSGDSVAVVFAPGVSVTEAAIRVVGAGGTPIRAGAFPNIIIARSDRPNFASDLYQQGAWLLLDPVLTGCADRRRS